MKAIILAVLISCPLMASQVPSSWLASENAEKSEQNFKAFGDYFDSLISVQEEMLEASESSLDKGLGDWKVAGHKTDLAVSKSGLFGFSALKGTSTVELSWSKAKQKTHATEDQERVIDLTTDMSEEEIVKAIAQSSNYLLQRLDSEKKRQKQLKVWSEKILTIHSALQGIALENQQRFIPSKFRVNLSLSYSSPLFGLTKLSGDARLLLEWKIVQHSSKSRRAQRLISNLVEDINEAMSKITPSSSNGYKFDQFAIALGLNKKSLFSFSKVKGDITGVLFFKVNEKKGEFAPLISNDEDYTWSEGTNKEDKSLKRRRFREGIVKTVEIGRWFSNKLSARHARWGVNKFKVNFTMNYSGIFGLTTTGGSGQIELYYTK